MDIATLVVKIKAEGTKEAEQAIDKIAKKAKEVSSVTSVTKTDTKGLQDTEKALKRVSDSSKDAKGAFKSFNDEILRLGRYMASIAAIYYTFKNIAAGIQAALQNIEKFQITVIGVASTLTDMAKEPELATLNFLRNLKYAKDTYAELELAAARYFASGEELIQGWNILTQKGVVLRKEELDYLGQIVDKIKLLTAGQVSTIQISQELRAAISGQARATDQLAMLVKDRLGGAWIQVFNQIRDTGSLKPLSDLLFGMAEAAPYVQRTILSQASTLATLVSQIGRAGLSQMYEDVVDYLKSWNDYLREHKDILISDIRNGYELLKADFIIIRNIFKELVSLAKEFGDAINPWYGSEGGGGKALRILGGAATGAWAGKKLTGSFWGMVGGGIAGGTLGYMGSAKNIKAAAKELKIRELTKEIYEQMKTEFNKIEPPTIWDKFFATNREKYLDELKKFSREQAEQMYMLENEQEKYWEEYNKNFPMTLGGLPEVGKRPKILTDESLNLLQQAESMLTRINEEGAKFSEDFLVKSIAHYERMIQDADKFLVRMRQNQELQQQAVYYEKLFGEARAKWLEATMEKRERDYWEWYVENLMPKAQAEFENLRLKMEDVTRQFGLANDAAQKLNETLSKPVSVNKYDLPVQQKLENLSTLSSEMVINAMMAMVQESSKKGEPISKENLRLIDELLKKADDLAKRVQTMKDVWVDTSQDIANAVDKTSNAIGVGLTGATEKFFSAVISEGKPYRTKFSDISSDLDDIITRASSAYGVSTSLIRAVISAESGGNARAVSPKGAMGLMQLMPGTAKYLGVTDPFDMEQNVMGGTRYLSELLKRFGTEAAAIMAYNMGPEGLAKALGGLRGIPQETKDFLATINAIKGGTLQVLSANDRWIQQIQQMTGMTPEQAKAMAEMLGKQELSVKWITKDVQMTKSWNDQLAEASMSLEERIGYENQSLENANALNMLAVWRGILEERITDQIEIQRRIQKQAEINRATTAKKANDDYVKQLEAKDQIAQQEQKYLSILQSETPFTDERLKLTQRIADIEADLMRNELKKFLAADSTRQKYKEQYEYLLNMAIQAKQIAVVMEQMKAGKMGTEGFMIAWSYERLKEASTRIYDTFKGLMSDMEKALSDAIYNAMTNKGNWSDILTGLGDAINRRIADMYAGMVFDWIASWGIKGLEKFVKRDGSSPERSLYVTLTNLPSGIGATGLGGTTGYGAGVNPTGIPTGSEEARQASAGFFSQVANFFSSLWNTASTWLANLGSSVYNFFSGIINWFSKTDILGGIGNMFASIGSWVGGIFGLTARTGGLVRMQEGGVVPGVGKGDIVPALLEPGELVVPNKLFRDMAMARLQGGGEVSPMSDFFNLISWFPNYEKAIQSLPYLVKEQEIPKELAMELPSLMERSNVALENLYANLANPEEAALNFGPGVIGRLTTKEIGETLFNMRKTASPLSRKIMEYPTEMAALKDVWSTMNPDAEFTLAYELGLNKVTERMRLKAGKELTDISQYYLKNILEIPENPTVYRAGPLEGRGIDEILSATFSEHTAREFGKRHGIDYSAYKIARKDILGYSEALKGYNRTQPFMEEEIFVRPESLEPLTSKIPWKQPQAFAISPEKFLYDMQDKLVEHKIPWSSGIWYEENAGDIFRELGKTGGADYSAGYIGEKIRKLQGVGAYDWKLKWDKSSKWPSAGDVEVARSSRTKEGFLPKLEEYWEGYNQLRQLTEEFAPERLRPSMLKSMDVMGEVANWIKSPSNFTTKIEAEVKELTKHLEDIGFKYDFSKQRYPEGFQTGGIVPGYGRGDIVPAMLEPGEFVVNRPTVDKIGKDFLVALQQGKVQHKFLGGILSGIGGIFEQLPSIFPISSSYKNLLTPMFSDLPFSLFGGLKGLLGGPFGGFQEGGFITSKQNPIWQLAKRQGKVQHKQFGGLLEWLSGLWGSLSSSMSSLWGSISQSLGLTQAAATTGTAAASATAAPLLGNLTAGATATVPLLGNLTASSLGQVTTTTSAFAAGPISNALMSTLPMTAVQSAEQIATPLLGNVASAAQAGGGWLQSLAQGLTKITGPTTPFFMAQQAIGLINKLLTKKREKRTETNIGYQGGGAVMPISDVYSDWFTQLRESDWWKQGWILPGLEDVLPGTPQEAMMDFLTPSAMAVTPQGAKWIANAKKYFETSRELSGAGFILPEGELLHIGSELHGEAAATAMNQPFNMRTYNKQLIEFMSNTDAIRYAAESGFMQQFPTLNLEMANRPTNLQISKIANSVKEFEGIFADVNKGTGFLSKSFSGPRTMLEFRKFIDSIWPPEKMQKGGQVPALLEPGEFVMDKDTVSKYGASFFYNLQKYHDGGFVGYQRGGAVQSAPITTTKVYQPVINVNIGGVQDAKSFAQSEEQIKSSMGAAVMRAFRRSGGG